MLGLGNLLSKGKVLGFPNKYSFNFDGSNDYLSLADSISLSGQFTISMWVYLDDNTSVNLLGDSSSSANFMWIDANNDIQIASSDLSITFTDSNMTTGSWQHILVTRDGSNVPKFYKNGTLVQTLSADAGTMTFNQIGAYHTGSNFFDGLIDEVAIWDSALDATAVAKLGSKPVDLTKHSASNLKLWLRAGDKILPEEDTSIARSDFYTDFDGTDDYVSIADDSSLTFTTALTASAWVNFTSISGDQTIVADWDYNNNGRSFQLRWDDDTTDTLEFHVCGDGSTIKENTANWTPVVGRWYHLTATYNAGTTKLYIDGVAQTVTADASQPTSLHSSSDPILIGSTGDATTRTNYFNGKISNLSLYKTLLDSQTIKQFAKSRFTPMRDNRFSVVDMDGSNDTIEVADNNSLDFTTALTISTWVKKTGTGYGWIVDKKNSSGECFKIDISSNSDGSGRIRARIFHSGGSVKELEDSTANYNDSQWHHIVFTYQASTAIKIYVDGTETALTTSSIPSSMDTSSDSLFIGSYIGTNYFFEGSMSSVALYNTAKSADEVYAIYQQGITYDESSLSGLVGYWRMGDDTSRVYPTIADSSSNSNDGTITNGASDDIVQQMVAGWDMGAFESTGEELSGETVTDPDFTLSGTQAVSTSGTYWTTGNKSTIADGKMTKAGGGTSDSYVSSILVSGKLYKAVIVVDSSDDAGTINARFGSTTNTVTCTAGTLTFYDVANSGNFQIELGYHLDCVISSVSVKEVLQSADLSDTYPAIIDVNEPVLGVELWDADASAVGSSVHSWITYAGATMITEGGAIKIAHNASNGYGSYVFLRDATDLSSDLTVGATYKFTFDAKVDTGTVKVTQEETDNFVEVSETSFTTKTIYFVATHASNDYIHTHEGQGSIIWLDNFSLVEIKGNVGLMTNQASSDLVYSSVLPDQSFLTGVNSAYNYIDLDGTDANIKNDSFTAHQSSTGTLSGWFNFDAVSGQYRFFGVGGSTTTGATRSIEVDGGSVFFIGYAEDWDSGADVLASNWYHLALTWNGTSVVIYVNGTAYSQTLSNLVTPTGTKIQIGGAVWNDEYRINGKASGVGVWDKVLSSSEISAIYTAGRHTNLLDKYNDNLRAYYAFGSLDSKTGLADTDSTIYDRSGNAVHGTTSGTATGDLKSPPNADPNGYAKGDTNRSTTKP